MTLLEKALLAGAKAFVAAMGASEGDKSAPAPTATARAAAPAAKPAVAAKAAAPAAKPAAKAAAAPAVNDDYLPVKALILELGAIPGTGRAAVAEILKQFGVARGPDLSADQYEEASELLKEKIAELSEESQA